MKKIFILMVVLLVLASSCQRSQFSTTTRKYNNGRVSYVNTYHKERSKISRGKSHKNHLTRTDAQNNISAFSSIEQPSIIKSVNTEINPFQIQGNETLIASTSTEPTMIRVNEDRGVPKFELSVKHQQDTIKPGNRSIGGTISKRAKQVIEFKNGRKDTVRITAISNDTLYYQLYGNPNINLSATIDKIDTVHIIRITEPLGVASTILPVFGMFPLLGLPFAVLGLILGIISLKRINRNPAYYKRVGVAYNGIFWGVLGTLISVLLIIAIINSN
jgi:hypothetical protein